MYALSSFDFGAGCDPVIAIDGQAGAGKSSCALLIADSLAIPTFNTGLTYRAATLAVTRCGLDLSDGSAVVRLLAETEMTIEENRVFLDGVEVTGDLRSDAVASAIPAISALSSVRSVLVAFQRSWVVEHGPCVVEGRDIGTVVFPDAVFKAFFVASDEARRARRPEERAIIERDRADSSRIDSPTAKAEDAVLVDTTNMSLSEVFEELSLLIDARLHEASGQVKPR